ncbi:MAG: aspartate carbamoyltransferase catalytic subunit [Chthonomonadaceae bacterium]|nr:aspartate carbamoyltransferase catalytic subunit [Chthonomonadaceae bacterium]
MNHLLTVRNLPKPSLEGLLESAKMYKSLIESGRPVPQTEIRTVGLLFFENSTRTRVSFEQAANYLGYRHVNFSGAGSSIKKGESLKDTVLTLRASRLEGVVIRHSASGMYNVVVKYFEGPVLNAGDGRHEHPTQALADALTILEKKGQIEGLKVAIVGDVANSRVARSNIWSLTKLGAEVRIVGPRILMPGHTDKLPVSVYYDVKQGIAGADVVMALRLQTERMDSGLVSLGEYRRLYQINRQTLKVAAPNAIVMHPGPMNRGVEIDDLTADGPQSVIRQQVSNGVFVRMAALSRAFDQEETPS